LPDPITNTYLTREGKRVTLIGAVVNFLLILLKFFAGVFGSSQALLADAVHSVSDLVTDIIVLLGLKIGQKEPDESHTFGHARFETLASSFLALALIVTALFLGIKSIRDIYLHTERNPGAIALIGAIISIASKEALYQYTVHTGRRMKSQLIMANAWHHRSDALSSVAVLLGVTGALINPSWWMLDSFAALLVSFFIIKIGLEIFGNTLKEFIDSAPPPDVLKNISQCASSVNGVISVHDLRVRTSGGLYQIETHIVVDGKLTITEGHNIAKEVENCLRADLDDFGRVIVHIDPSDPDK
jgi:cation diffusion facilitator family transporter